MLIFRSLFLLLLTAILTSCVSNTNADEVNAELYYLVLETELKDNEFQRLRSDVHSHLSLENAELKMTSIFLKKRGINVILIRKFSHQQDALLLKSKMIQKHEIHSARILSQLEYRQFIIS